METDKQHFVQPKITMQYNSVMYGHLQPPGLNHGHSMTTTHGITWNAMKRRQMPQLLKHCKAKSCSSGIMSIQVIPESHSGIMSQVAVTARQSSSPFRAGGRAASTPCMLDGLTGTPLTRSNRSPEEGQMAGQTRPHWKVRGSERWSERKHRHSRV